VVEYPAALFENYTVSPYPGRIAAAHKQAPQFGGAVVDTPAALSEDALAGTFEDTGAKSEFGATWTGAREDALTPAFDWFEKFHVIPRAFILGNILSTVLEDIEVYSAFRDTHEDWNTYVNNAGTGVDLIGQPGLPYSFPPQTNGYLGMQLEISTSGPPFVDTTLDFGFDAGVTPVFIEFQRVVLFSVAPESGYQEILEFLTEIIRKKDGSEQRLRLRKCPRQVFEWDLKLVEGPEHTRFENLVFDWQSRAFGVPLWHESTYLTSAALLGATALNVSSTAYADYRTTGSNLVLIYQSSTIYDILPVLSFTATTITLDGETLHAYPVGTRVMPCRTGFMERLVRGSRYSRNLATFRARITVEDNNIDIASTAAFSTYNSKVLIDEYNVIDGPMSESFERQITAVDSETGISRQYSTWDRNRREHHKTFFLRNQQELWEARQLLHSLGGKQVSWYHPTFHDDLVPVLQLTNGSTALDIQNVGYTQFVQSRQPKNVIRITFNTGDPALVRGVTGSVVVDEDRETLTLDAVWPQTFTVDEVERIEFVEKIRFDNDAITIVHQPGARASKIFAPVKVVLE
jgi:hypothetical protein